MSKYLWCEDSKAGFQFWRELFGKVYPDFIVETKRGNSNLRQAVSNIKSDGNIYYILMDMAVDNPDVLREVGALRRQAAGKDNVKLIKIYSFEFSLLSFEKLEQWVFAEKDDLKAKRSDILEARKVFVKLILNGGNAEELGKLKTKMEYSDKVNTEQISVKLLNGITRNTGFETDKAKVGPCFIIDCCEWKERMDDDICGLDAARITADEKMRQLVDYSVLKNAFQEAGLNDKNI